MSEKIWSDDAWEGFLYWQLPHQRKDRVAAATVTAAIVMGCIEGFQEKMEVFQCQLQE